MDLNGNSVLEGQKVRLPGVLTTASPVRKIFTIEKDTVESSTPGTGGRGEAVCGDPDGDSFRQGRR